MINAIKNSLYLTDELSQKSMECPSDRKRHFCAPIKELHEGENMNTKLLSEIVTRTTYVLNVVFDLFMQWKRSGQGKMEDNMELLDVTQSIISPCSTNQNGIRAVE